MDFGDYTNLDNFSYDLSSLSVPDWWDTLQEDASTEPMVTEEEPLSNQDLFQSKEAESSSLSTSKRGRKVLYPGLKGKKTEDLNKFWLRKFRSYIRKNLPAIQHTGYRDFWDSFLDRSKEPGMVGSTFKSYSKKFKSHLKSNDEYLALIQRWYVDYGEQWAQGKHRNDPEFALAIWEYAKIELMDFEEKPFWRNFEVEDFIEDVLQ